MPYYVALVNWTDQGIRNVKDSVKRGDALIATAEKLRCKVRHLFYTMGPHDIVTVIEAPNDQAVSTLTLSMGALGYVRTLTMRAYEKEEMEGILSGLA